METEPHAGGMNSPSGPSQAAKAVRETTIRVLTERIRLLGIDRSGAYEHYKLQLSNGFPIPPGEIAVLGLIRKRLPNLRSYHEIGSGLGTLPLMLAYDGFASVGIDRDEPRHLTATVIQRELSRVAPQVESNCRLIGAPFPDAVADLDVSDSIAILTDFVSSQTPKDYVRICRGLAQYRYVLLDLQRFCIKRDTKQQQDQLVKELALYGLTSCEDVIDLEGQGYYQLFECKPLEGQRDVASKAGDEATSAPHAELAASPNEQQATPLPVSMARGELQVEPIAQVPEPVSLRGVVLPPMPRRVRRKRFGGLVGLSAFLMIGIPTLLAGAYYGYLASDQFVTNFQFAVRGPSQASAARLGGSSMVGAGAMSPDSFVVTDYINSPQAVADVERVVDLRAMFTKPSIDSFSRLSFHPLTEELNAYWTGMVSANFDLISGNVSVSVRAFTAHDSLILAQALVASSDEMFRRLNTKAQQDFVQVADENVQRAEQRLNEARQALFVFREGSGLVDPERTAQAGAAIIDDLRKQLASSQAQYASLKSSAPNSPKLAALTSHIAALEERIKKEEPLGSSKVKSVTAETLSEYQKLELVRQTTEKQYTEALGLRTQAYLIAQNQQSYLALFVAPILPQKSLYPNRPRAILTVALSAAATWFVSVLIIFALRDHLI